MWQQNDKLSDLLKVFGLVIAFALGYLLLVSWLDSIDQKNWRQIGDFCESLLNSVNNPLYDQCVEEAHDTFYPDYEAGY